VLRHAAGPPAHEPELGAEVQHLPPGGLAVHDRPSADERRGDRGQTALQPVVTDHGHEQSPAEGHQYQNRD